MTLSTIYWGTGRRKTAVARVRLIAGKGRMMVNDKPLEEYFDVRDYQERARQPLVLLNMLGRYDVLVRVNGGGLNGQAGAVRHGLARALVKMDETLKPSLKRAGFLKRDPRMKERKKYGQKGARARFQFSKR
ncbi:MAG TPA: 30S ribosomal protein S9 [Candidatus Mcinerneyibacteriales bacterium]|nr:30S ribosomal protein S9 [Candidatus Mcinerneyibacteriota bacterium]HOO59836.1 30S ribosomal protein S9 [Candidatus Mcinerneyibacteriales bacterium]HPE19946.1 30S ribosomal protein S9 [Candidatus Mcinerneyibacteriales bacterium]HPJ70230.1 30S ribosomal protein S9 [Candidatus Mcinerneyibacteriales bacterium]HPQ89528.1 30S ribosomal protein S9 [Candidatus Mcinerneyibacteriales bacterium]